MSNPASFEEITTPITPVEKWFADYRILIGELVFSTGAELAASDEGGEKVVWQEFLKANQVAEAQLEHLDVLEALCDPRLDSAAQIENLGDHVVQLHAELTSPTLHQDVPEHTTPAVEEAKRKAKVKDTLSLRTVLTGQQQIDS